MADKPSLRETMAANAASAANASNASDDVGTPPMGEAAASVDGRDITIGFFGNIRPMQDSVLAARGGGLEVYEEVLRDWQCFSTFQQRRLAVVSREWDVQPGADDKRSVMAADSLKAQLDAIGFDSATNKMLYGLWYGHGIGECLWSQNGREITLEGIKVKKARRFQFDKDGGLRLQTMTSGLDGELMPARKFWTFATGADNDDDPYGLGLAHYCFWPVWLKKNGYRFWSMLLDKFGMPTSIGKFPPGTSPEDQKKLLNAIAAIQSSSGVIIPDGMIIELLEASRSGQVGNDQFVDRMDAAIAKVILSQTMTTDNGSSKSQSSTHMEVRDEVVKADADLICSSFNNGPAKWLTDWNYPGAVPPKVWRKIDPPEDLDKLADRDSKIYAMGFEPSEEYITDTYGEGWTKKQSPLPLPGLPGNPLPDNLKPGNAQQVDPVDPKDLKAKTTPAFAEAPPLDAAGVLARQAETLSGDAMRAMIDEVRAMLETSESLEEFQQQLMVTYPAMKLDDLAAVLRDAMVTADLTARDDHEADH